MLDGANPCRALYTIKHHALIDLIMVLEAFCQWAIAYYRYFEILVWHNDGIVSSLVLFVSKSLTLKHVFISQFTFGIFIA